MCFASQELGYPAESGFRRSVAFGFKVLSPEGLDFVWLPLSPHLKHYQISLSVSTTFFNLFFLSVERFTHS